MLEVTSFPGLPHLQFLIACSMQKRRGEAWGIFSRDTRHDHHMSSRLRSTVRVIYETILHSALPAKMGQAPTESYTERMKRTQATSHDSKGLPSDKRENAATMTQSSHGAKRRHYLEFHPLYHSYPSAV